MQTILGVTVPFFALVLFGYVAARRCWVPVEAVPAFNGFLLFFAVPAMLFRFASNTPFADITNGRYFLAWSISGVIVLIVVTVACRRLLGQRLRDAAFYGLAGAVANAGFMGVPLIVALLGERAAAPVILAIVADLVVVGSIGLLLAEADGATRSGWKADLREALVRIFLNPFLLSMLAGAAFSGLHLQLVTPAAEIVKLLADSAGPCALFAIGLSLVRPDAPLKTPMLALPVAAKLLLQPAVVWMVMTLLGVDDFARMVATLVAALPSAGWVFIFAMRYEADAGRISAAILWTTALAFVTFSTLVWLYGIGKAG